MNCLHCGDCCLRMSPLSYPDPCPKLVQVGTFYFCGDYEHRPEACRRHENPGRHCPVGVTKLGITEPGQVAIRIDMGYALIRRGWSRGGRHA